jgi:hypothetical protein
MVNAVITEKEIKSGNYLIILNILWVRACVYHDLGNPGAYKSGLQLVPVGSA